MDDSHASLPESAPASAVPNSVSSANDQQERSPRPDGLDISNVPAEHRDAMRRLHRTIEAAVATIEELRAENERLRQRVEELEAQPSLPDDEAVLALDDDPQEVREQISQFINTIDTYLDTASVSETAPQESGSQ